MRFVLALALVASPAAAQEVVLTCAFGAETVAVETREGAFGLRVGEEVFPATLVRPGMMGRVVAVFAMLDQGPVMLAVATGEAGAELRADLTAARVTDAGLASETTTGACREGG